MKIGNKEAQQSYIIYPSQSKLQEQKMCLVSDARLCLRERLHVRFCVRIAIRFEVRFLAKGLSRFNFSSIFAEMSRQTIVIDV
jgi:hypothetical protein